MKALVAVAVVAAAALLPAAAVPAPGPPRECTQLPVCVPVVGPWVAILPGDPPSPPSVLYQLSCPLRYLIGGVAADVASSSVDVSFLGRVGSPVSPGLTTSSAAVFVGTNGAAGASSFRPHIGCVPTSGGGARSSTSVRQAPPVLQAGQPVDRRAVNVRLAAGTTRSLRVACPAGERAVGASHAFAFVSAAPPGEAQLASLHAKTSVARGVAHVTAQAGAATSGERVQLQVLLSCVVKAR